MLRQLLIAVIMSQAVAFMSVTHPRTTTFLRAMTFEPPADDDCTLDGSDCEESIFDRKRREKKESDVELRELYAKEGLDLTAIDRMASPDQFDNAAGGGIIPGMQMSALMEDD